MSSDYAITGMSSPPLEQFGQELWSFDITFSPTQAGELSGVLRLRVDTTGPLAQTGPVGGPFQQISLLGEGVTPEAEVPDPAPALLLGLGALVMAVTRRRKQHRAEPGASGA